MEYVDANVFCGTILFVLTSQFAHGYDCSNSSFTIEVTNSSNGIFTAKEDTTQRITITVTPVTSCNEWELSVTENNYPVCKFVINTGDVCKVPFGRDRCTCGSRGARGQEFHFNKNVTRKDNGAVLRWNVELTNGTINSSKTVNLNITYPTRVTSLYVEGYGDVTPVPVPTNTSVKVICSWLDGNPLTAVHLFNSIGDKSSATTTSRYSTHNTFTHRRCHHLEVVRCEAFGSERNQSMSLLGMCPPEVSNSTELFLNVIAGETVFLSFNVLSHTLNITQCQLRQRIEFAVNSTDVTAYSANGSKKDKVRECAVTQNLATHRLGNEPNEKDGCECIVNGKVPDLTVTVRIINVTEEDAGNWTVNVFNSLGNVSFKFSLSVLQIFRSGIQTLNNTKISVVLVAGVLIYITFVCSIIGVLFRKMRKKETMPLNSVAEITSRQVSTHNEFDTVYYSSITEITEQLGNESIARPYVNEIASRQSISHQSELGTVYYGNLKESPEQFVSESIARPYVNEIASRQSISHQSELGTVYYGNLKESPEQLGNEAMGKPHVNEIASSTSYGNLKESPGQFGSARSQSFVNDITNRQGISHQRELDTLYYRNLKGSPELLGKDHYETLRNQEIGIQSKYTSLNTLGHKADTKTDDHDTSIETELPYEALKQNEVGQRSPYADLSK